MWIGFLSLLVEILGAIIRCLLEQCGRRVKLWQLFQCVVVSAVALLMFAVSLVSNRLALIDCVSALVQNK